MNVYPESESEVAKSCLTLCDPCGLAHQAPPSMGFSGQEYWSGLPFPSPGDLPDPGIESRSPTLQAASLPSEPPGKPKLLKYRFISQLLGIMCIKRGQPSMPASQSADDRAVVQEEHTCL